MTRSEVSNLVMIIMAFLVGGVVLTFISTGISKAESKAANRVQINSQDTLNQLIMYDTLIAHVCDKSTAAGALDNSGSRMYDSWKSYQKLWETHEPNLFRKLNKTFPRPELGCYGTGTTFGATSIGSYVDPTDKEWRNDMEGKYSKIRFVINGTENWYDGYGGTPGSSTDTHAWTPPCFWFDQPSNSWHLEPRDSPGKGWEGITDAMFVFEKPEDVNLYFRFWGSGEADPSGCEEPWFQTMMGPDESSGVLRGGPLLMVTMLSSTGTDLDFKNTVSMSGSPVTDQPGDPGANDIDARDVGAKVSDDHWVNNGGDEYLTIDYQQVKLCKGMTGYIQTNTGYTTGGGGSFAGEENPTYTAGNLPGFGDKERWNPENAPKDNSLHPVIVITDMGECS